MRDFKERSSRRITHTGWSGNYIGYSGILEQKNPTYPPNNLIQVSDNTYRVEVALAGFSVDDIDISVEGSRLNVVYTGESSDQKDTGERYIHRGISARPFTLSYALAEGVEVTSADMSDGILTVKLESKVKLEKSTRIKINTKSQLNG